ncbi:MAG: phasin family protein [Gammaproteobacteria bacterium]|nr:phasin family protein [Gammaproteobacteria bacterium]NIR84028.1 phasin family protein [Gammaproteobacteria bacterium]NIR89172.1 phasin family protein [Gammaproteobacteria bacterium]NIU04974.1 phasin family protein [Gammaproteobacteria bacterium]NIV52140.1 TIGR01841 family phasin [Gammaproteobacteria bacterium]
MQNTFDRVYEQMAEANKSALQRAIQLNGIVTRTQNHLAEQQLALVESYLNTGAKQLEALAEANDPKDFMSRQAELATQVGERWVALVQRVVDIQGEARDEVTALMREGLKTLEPKATASLVAKQAKPAAKEAKPAKEAKESKGSTAAA